MLRIASPSIQVYKYIECFAPFLYSITYWSLSSLHFACLSIILYDVLTHASLECYGNLWSDQTQQLYRRNQLSQREIEELIRNKEARRCIWNNLYVTTTPHHSNGAVSHHSRKLNCILTDPHTHTHHKWIVKLNTYLELMRIGCICSWCCYLLPYFLLSHRRKYLMTKLIVAGNIISVTETLIIVVHIK